MLVALGDTFPVTVNVEVEEFTVLFRWWMVNEMELGWLAPSIKIVYGPGQPSWNWNDCIAWCWWVVPLCFQQEGNPPVTCICLCTPLPLPPDSPCWCDFPWTTVMQWHLRDVVGSVPGHCNKANIAVKQVTWLSWFLSAYRNYLCLNYSIVY